MIKRLHRRDFYPFVGEIIYKGKDSIPCVEADIIKYAAVDGYGNSLKEEDISVRRYTINYAQKEKSPFDAVKFYNPPKINGKSP